MTVAVLFAHRKSVYKTLPGLDVFDEDRDARTYAGSWPVVAHPPCRGWGRFRKFAKPAEHELQLAIDAVATARRLGGVIEHPAHSRLWQVLGLPIGRETDDFGGFTIHVDQCWWSHPARKGTFLYVVGLDRRDV